MSIDIYFIVLLFFSGLFFGKLFVVLGLKLTLKEKGGMNDCPYCEETYTWQEFIPLFSYFLTFGKCNYCHKKKSIWLPILEVGTAILFSLSYILYGFSYEMIVLILLTSLFVIICVSDFQYYIINNEPLFVASIFILSLKCIFFGYRTFLISLISGFCIFLFMYGIKKIGDKIFKVDSLGGGDIKLAGFFGFCLGVRLSIVSLILGALLAFPYALYTIISHKEKEIPFGPFLIGALVFVFLFMDPVRNFLNILFGTF